MNLEERLHEVFAAQVDSPPAVGGLADRSLRRAARVRRTQAVASVAVAALIAVGVPLRLAASRDRDAGNAKTSREPRTAVWGRTFLSTSLTEHGQRKELVAGTRIQLTFTADHRISANAGCNEMSAAGSAEGGQLVVGDVATTAKGCEPYAAYGAQDEWLARFLTSRPRWTLNGTTLALDNASIRMLLDDQKTADIVRPLRGTGWVVDGIIEGDSAWSAPASGAAYITFGGDGRVIGSTGCNSFSGQYVIDDAKSTITFSQVGHTSIACDQVRMRVERAVLAALEGRADFAIRADTLQLSRSGGNGLSLRSTTAGDSPSAPTASTAPSPTESAAASSLPSA